MQLSPVAGLVSPVDFLRHLAKRVFLATQYIRHPSVPLYTPEPDIVHELVGHATTLAHPRFVELNVAFGRASQHAPAHLQTALAHLYWWTMEFGVVIEQGAPKAFGAGLLSSFGELGRLSSTPLVPLDIELAAQTPYDPTCYQPALFAARSFSHLSEELLQWLRQHH